ncbi:MAG TPA: HAMP domain-containing sensor histidine kinase [Chthonomonadaceae bacterium]|nr:HAMP domain-containing sensor histidine kinase [Chthonomonadaceae bacterium]
MSPASLSRLSAFLGGRRSVRHQLIAWNVATLALLLGALGLFVRSMVRTSMMASIDHDLDLRTRGFVRTPPPPPGPPPGEGPPGMDFGSQPPGQGPGPPPPGPQGFPPFERRGGPPPNTDPYRPRRFDLQGHSLGPPDSAPMLDPAGYARAKQQGQDVFSAITFQGEPVRALSRPFPVSGPVQGVVQAGYGLTEVNRALAGLNAALLMLIPVGLLCAGVAGTVLTDRILRRVRVMSQAAEHLSARDLSQRLPVVGSDEFADLAETFNSLLGRLEIAFRQQDRLIAQQRWFTADASHELKTPLTIIKGNTSMALRGKPTEAALFQTLQEIDGAADTMSRLVQDLLLLARSDEGQLGKDRIELLLQEVLERAIANVAKCQGAPITLQIAGESPRAMGNEAELTRLFSNLLDNAVHYTPQNGKITVTARREGASALVTVADTGIGIAPEHLPHLGERFYRVDPSRTHQDGGTGLGLSICKSIVEAHGGTLTFTSTPGKGTVVTVTLPALSP